MIAYTSHNGVDFDNYIYLLFCDIANYKHWLVATVNPDKFFENYDLLIRELKFLTEVENESAYPFYQPYPSEQLKEYEGEYPHLVNDFLHRSWEAMIDSASKLKTETGRQRRVASFFAKLDPFKSRLPTASLRLIESLQKEEIDWVEALKRTKPKPVFDSQAEKDLLDGLKKCTNLVQAHYAMYDLLQFYYRFRDVDACYLNKCIQLCKLDIEHYSEIEQEYIRQMAQCVHNTDKEQADEEINSIAAHGFRSDGFFERLAIIYDHLGEYDLAVEVCNKAISHGLDIKNFSKRIARYEKKQKRNQNI